MSTTSISCVFAFGAAVLALWLVWRYPHYGPGTLRRGALLVVCAWALLLLLTPATAAAEQAAGASAALLFVDLPMLVFVFWSTVHLLRLYIGTVERHDF